MVILLFYEITKFVLRSFLRSLLSCFPHFGKAAVLVRNVLRTIRSLWLLKNLSWKRLGLSAEIFSKTAKTGSTNRWEHSGVLKFFPQRERTSVWNVNAIPNLLAKNAAPVLMTFGEHSNVDSKTKNFPATTEIFWAVKFCWRWIFLEEKSVFSRKMTVFLILKFSKVKKFLLANFDKEKKNFLQIQFRAILSTLLILKYIFSLLRKYSRGISLLLHSTTSLQ